MDNEYQYVPLYSKNEEWITCTYAEYEMAQREGCITRILTPAPLSEKKQEGETGLSIAVDILLEKGGLKRDERAKTIYHLGAAFGSKWQSQNTAKQIDQDKARIVELEAENENLKDLNGALNDTLSDIEVKHQEELANYNSYAASHIEQQFENKIEELAEWLERDKQVYIGMMGELANPAVVVYDTCISRLKAINID